MIIRVSSFCACLLLFPSILAGNTITIDFEGLTDGTVLGAQYPGVTFSNTIVLTAGVSVNELEFPPRSGDSVASDNGGPIAIIFASPITSFDGYFTYAEPLTLDAFGLQNNLLASVTSAFSNNEAQSGVPGSFPNELLHVSAADAISRIVITGDPAGASFTLDDATYSTTVAAAPEPSTWSFAAASLLVISVFAGGKRRTGLVLLLGLPFAWSALAATSVSLSSSTSSITAGVSTPVALTAQISGATPLAGGVTVVQVDASGNAGTVVGVMADVGGGAFTLTAQFAPSQAGSLYLQASVAFKGSLLRSKSPVLTLVVLPQPQAPCPPPWSDAIVYGTVIARGSGTFDYFGGTLTTSRSVVAGVQLTPNFGASAGCSFDDGTTSWSTVSDEADSAPGFCPSIGTFAANGSGFGPGSGHLQIQGNTYQFFASGTVEGTETIRDCNGTDSGGFLFAWATQDGPGIASPAPFMGAVINGSADYVATGDLNGNANWNFTWSLSPVRDDTPDDPCTDLRGSEVGCQGQTLGESLPVTGTRFYLHYASDRSPGRAGADVTAVADARSMGGWTLSVHHVMEPMLQTWCLNSDRCNGYAIVPKALFLGDGSTRSDASVQAPVQANGNLYLTAADGSEVYVFRRGDGRHLQTLRPLTGAVLYTFGYDNQGLLASITDANGNITRLQRATGGQPTAIVSSYGQITTLAVDANGYLSRITDPAGNAVNLTNSATGLLTSLMDANGNTYKFQYDGLGRLLKDSDPAGGSLSLARADTTSGYAVTKTTAQGRTSTYGTAFSSVPELSMTQAFVNTRPDGLKATESSVQQSGTIAESMTLPNGTMSNTELSTDPRWGIQAPIVSSNTTTLGGLTAQSASTRAVTLSVPGDPFSLTAQTDTLSINRRTYTSVYSATNRVTTASSPMGRQLTETLDAQERVASQQTGGLLPVQFTYDSRGRVATLTQGARSATFSYDSNGRLSSVTDPLNFTKMYAYDPAGHLTALTLADGRTIHYTYDSNGNLTSLTPPGKSNHSFSYSKVNLLSSYTPPSLGIAGGASYAYSADRQMTSIVRPDGRSAGFAYDNAGRLNSMVTPSGTTQYAYSGSTGNLISASISGGEGLAYSYNGPLVTGSAWTGPVAGSVARGYDNNFWMISESVDGENPILFARDNDGLVTSAGSLLIQRNSQNTLIAGTTLGSVNDTRSYNGYGELTGYMATSGAATIWSVQYTRDALGRIATRTETIQGASKTVAYARDAAGRLTGVTLNGNGSAIYSYDSNSNRLTAVTASGTSAGTYDAQDRLLRYGNTAYTYNASGDLTSKVTGTQVTTYQYDVMGNLVAVSLPGGGSINYLVDAGNRRVGKLLNGAVIAGFLYDGNRIVAQLNAGGAVVSRFVYGTRPNAPDYIVKGGVTYRIFCDQLGSPRLVVNSSTGQIAERIDYDEFGNVTGDTNPGFQPFGFAGGLYDQDTGLVRFGARDYDPKTGRWTAKDPILFSGGSSNLYSYALNNPVDLYDPSGLEGTNEADGGSELVRDVAIQAGAEVAEHYVEAKGEQIIEKLATGEEEAGPPEFKPGATPLKEYEEVNKNAVETKPEVSTFSNFVQHIWQVCSDGLRGITSNSSQGTAQPAGSNDSTPAPGQRVPLPTFQPPDAGVQQ